MGMACTAPQGWFSGLAVLLRRCLAKFINRSKSENDNYATAKFNIDKSQCGALSCATVLVGHRNYCYSWYIPTQTMD